MSRSMLVRWGTVASLTLVAMTSSLRRVDGQTRDQLIDRAALELDPFVAADLLRTALHPDSGLTDARWGQALQLLAEVLIDPTQLNQPSVGAAWLRWGVRRDPQLRPDPQRIPEVQRALEAAQSAIRLESDSAASTWEWNPGESIQSDGRIALSAGMPDVQVVVIGVGAVTAQRPLLIAPGTYTILASRSGYVPSRVEREVLPGVTTRMAFDLALEPIVVDSLMAAGVESMVVAGAARLVARRFGQSSCGAGVLVGADGLLLTTYEAVRGAESIDITFGDGSRFNGTAQIASYDVPMNAAVVYSQPRTNPLTLGESIAVGQYGWAVRFIDCDAPAAERVTVTSWDGRPTGRVALSAGLQGWQSGSPLVSRSGGVIGLVSDSNLAMPVDHVRELVAVARQNVESARLLSLLQVAQRENHVFGSADLRSDVEDARARVTPLESWHWAGLATTQLLPFRFIGPRGRYQVDVLVNDDVVSTHEMEVRAAAAEQFALGPGVQLGVSSGGGGFPVPVALLGIGALGAVAAVLLGGGGDGGGNGGTPIATGGIIITYPIP